MVSINVLTTEVPNQTSMLQLTFLHIHLFCPKFLAQSFLCVNLALVKGAKLTGQGSEPLYLATGMRDIVRIAVVPAFLMLTSFPFQYFKSTNGQLNIEPDPQVVANSFEIKGSTAIL